VIIATVVVSVLPATVASQQPAPPRFRGGLDRVTVDAIIVDKDGAPVRDLTLQDFRLEVDGKPRTLQSAELVTFDRPYLMVVTDRATGEPLFMARVANPSGN